LATAPPRSIPQSAGGCAEILVEVVLLVEIPFQTVEAGEELGLAIREFAGHAADHGPPGAEQPDKPVAEKFFPGSGQVGFD